MKDRNEIIFFECPAVYCLSHTKLSRDIYNYLIDFGIDYSIPDIVSPQESIIEVAGKHCYMSFGKGRKSIEDYIRGILEHRHFSVIEHLSITFVIRGVSRYFTHEFVRHRHNSYSQFSTRYCDPIGFVIPYDLRIFESDAKEVVEKKKLLLDEYKEMCLNSYDYYMKLKSELKDIVEESSRLNKRKRLRGAARFGLLSGLEAPIVVSGNLRSWFEYMTKRLPCGNTGFPDPEIACVSEKIFDIILEKFPITTKIFKEIFLGEKNDK